MTHDFISMERNSFLCSISSGVCTTRLPPLSCSPASTPPTSSASTSIPPIPPGTKMRCFKIAPFAGHFTVWGGSLRKRFSIFFLESHRLLRCTACSCHAAQGQASKGNFQKTFYKASYTTCRSRLHICRSLYKCETF